MRRSLLCFVILLALPCAAHAEQTRAAEASTVAAPALDLSFDPTVAAEQDRAPLVPETAAAPPARDGRRPFSVGLNLKSRQQVGSPAARAAAVPQQQQTLSDKIEGIVERASIGVTGTYRF